MLVTRNVVIRLVACSLVLGPSVLGLGGCLERRLSPLTPELGIAERVRLGSSDVADVDLLLVIDDSNSMEEEQRNLAEEVEGLVRDLVSPPDEDGDGSPDWNPVRSLRVGIVSTDLGTRGVELPASLIGNACLVGPAGERPLEGHDGRLETSPSCGAPEGVLGWGEGEDPATFSERVSCVVEGLGVTGCGMEQQLEAAARGIERASADPAHAFPRPDSVLAVLVLSDEEDCSLAEPASFYASFDATNRNVICQRNADQLTAIADLARRLRGDRPANRFVFSAITGVPTEVSGASPATILAHPDMAYGEVLGDRGLEPRKACEVEGLGYASPGRRLVELALALGTERVHSICTEDFGPAIDDLTSRIGRALDGACLARRAAPGPDGTVDCSMQERLPLGTRCSDVPGRVAVRIDDAGREICAVPQATASGAEGWFYDQNDARCARIEYTEGAAPPLGTELDIRCWFPLETPPVDGPTGP